MMTFQKNKLSLFALTLSVLSLNACGFTHPNAMPTGYNYHHENYKSPITETSSKVTVEQRQYMDAAQAEQFRNAVYDLLERLTMRAGMPPKPVFVVAPEPMTTFYANIDNDLRESMRHIGYAISDTPNASYVFTYEATPLEQTNTNSNNVHLTLRIFDSFSATARQLTEESGAYFIQGADKLNIEASRYRGLPSPAQIQKLQIESASAPIQEIVREPIIQAPVAPIIETPAATTSLPIVPQAPHTPVSTTRSTSPAFVSQPIPQTEDDIRSIIRKPSVQMPKISEPTMPLKTKKPSHDDIIIINRDDKAKALVSQPTAQAPITKDIPALPPQAAVKQITKAVPSISAAQNSIDDALEKALQ